MEEESLRKRKREGKKKKLNSGWMAGVVMN